MYRFSITTPDGKAVIAIAAQWDEPAEPEYSGDDYGVESALEHIEENGYTPFGHIATDTDFIEPQTIHYIFTEAKGYSVEVLEGGVQEYINEYSRDDDNESDWNAIQDSARSEAAKETEKEIAILDATKAPTWRERLKACKSMSELKGVFWEVVNGSEQEEEPERTDKDDSDPAEPSTGNTFGLQGKDGFGTGTTEALRESLNAQASEIINTVSRAEDLTPEQRETLMQYSGRGGIGETISEYYTPTPIAEGVWDMLEANGFESGNVLEPSAGSGVFSAVKKSGAILTAVEMDETSSAVNALLHPEEDNIHAAFEEVAGRTEDNTFDSVIGNIPFGNARDKAHLDPDPAYRNEKNLERYFIHRAIDKVKHGGLIALIVPGKVVSNRGDWNKFRKAISYKAEFLGAVKMPNETFGGKGVQGTNVVTDVILLKKHPEELYTKIHDLPQETLKESNVLWETFISGKWFEQDGRRWVTGTGQISYGFQNREELAAGMKRPELLKDLRRKLAVKFDSRINWSMLEAEEPTPRNYKEGDRRFISAREYEFDGESWELVDVEAETLDGISEDKYGADSYEALNSKLDSIPSSLELTYEQLLNVKTKFPGLLSETHKTALNFAAQQPEKERQLAFRGVLVGQMISDIKRQHDEGNDVDSELAEVRPLIEKQFAKYGDPRKHKKLKQKGGGSQLFAQFANAKTPEGEFTDLLTGDLDIQSALGYNAKDLRSVVEYLFELGADIQGINSPLDLETVAKLYQGNKKIETLGDIAEFDGIHINSAGKIVPEKYHLSGNAFLKIDGLNNAIDRHDDPRVQKKFLGQIQQIKNACDFSSLQSGDIRVRIADAWIDRKYVLEFLEEMGYDRFSYRHKVEQYDETGEVISVDYEEDTARSGGEFVSSVKNLQGLEAQLLKYLNGGNIQGGGRGKNAGRTKSAQYREQVNDINEQFTDWLKQHPDSELVEEQYNRVFHSEIQKNYSSAPLEIKGLSNGVTLHDYQCESVRQLSEEGKGILAHGVGLGKTFTGLALAKYNEQMGRANRTCTVVPKSVLTNWYHEAKALYKNMNGLLVVGISPERDEQGEIMREAIIENGKPKTHKKTGEPLYRDVMREDTAEEIREKLWSIPQSNSIRQVIMSDSRFSQIPVKLDTLETYATEWVDKNLLKDADASGFMESRLGESLFEKKEKKGWQEAKKRAKLTQKYSADGTGKNQSYPYYEDMGFDSVIIDEAHYYKNVYNGGSDANRIEFLSNPAVAKKATDMALKMAHLRKENDGKGCVLLTATPITNSPLEVYNALSLVSDVTAFEQMGIAKPDDFIRMFGRTENRDRENLKGELIPVEALVGFDNLKSLRSVFYQYVNQKTAKQVFGDRSKVSKAPQATEHREFVNLGDAEERLFEVLREEAQECVFARDAEDSKGRPIFSIIRDMERLTTDRDLFYKKITFRFPKGTKAEVEKMVGKLRKSVKGKRFDIEENKQIEVNIPKEYELTEAGGVVELRIAQEYEAEIEKALAKSKTLNINQVSHPTNPKYAKLIENCTQHANDGGKQIVFSDELVQHHRIGRILAHHIDGLELDQIAYISGSDTPEDPDVQEVADAFNQGTYKLVICNQKAEVGINLQKGTTAIHHLTLPFTPASIEQRNGRGVRQGNEVENVDVYFYLGKSNVGKSIDERRLEILLSKANWIGEIMNGSEASAANADADADDANKYDDVLAADPEMLAKHRAKEQAKREAQAQAARSKEATNALRTIMRAEGEIQKLLNTKAIRDEKAAIKKNQKYLEQGYADGKPERHGFGSSATYITPKINFDRHPDKKEDIELDLKLAEQNLARLEAIANEKKAKHDKAIKRNKNTLKTLKKSGELPFDDVLIENADQATPITGSNIYLYPGQFWEYADGLYKVESINKGVNEVTLTTEIGSYHVFEWMKKALKLSRTIEGSSVRWTVAVSRFPHWAFTEVNCTERELDIRKFKADKDIYYVNLPTEYDKEIFFTHGDIDKFSFSTPGLFRKDGKLVISADARGEKFEELVWPDRTDEKLKKELADMLLPKLTTGNLSSDEQPIARALFGDWKKEIQKYGEQAVEQDVKTKALELFKAKAEKNSELWGDPERLKKIFFSSYSGESKFATEVKEIGLGSNFDEIEEWAKEIYRSQKSANAEKVKLIEEERQRQKEAEFKALQTDSLKADRLPEKDTLKHLSYKQKVVAPEQQENSVWFLREFHQDMTYSGTEKFLMASYAFLPDAMGTKASFETAEDAIQSAQAWGWVAFPAGFTRPGKPVVLGKLLSELTTKAEISSTDLATKVNDLRLKTTSGQITTNRVKEALQDDFVVDDDKIREAVEQSKEMRIDGGLIAANQMTLEEMEPVVVNLANRLIDKKIEERGEGHNTVMLKNLFDELAKELPGQIFSHQQLIRIMKNSGFRQMGTNFFARGEKPEPEAPEVKEDKSGQIKEQFLSDKVVKALANIEIKARVIAEPLSWDRVETKKKRGGGTYNKTIKGNTPQNALFLEDALGYKGTLAGFFSGRSNPNKAKYEAQYIRDPDPRLPGSWWALSARGINHDELISELETEYAS